jgi:hypothetical protein
MKTIDELVKEYDAAYQRSTKEYGQWRDEQIARARGVKVPGPNEAYKGYEIDYGYFQTELAATIKGLFNLTDKQTGYIMGEAYERYHSGYSDMFWGAHGIAEFVSKFPKD